MFSKNWSKITQVSQIYITELKLSYYVFICSKMFWGIFNKTFDAFKGHSKIKKIKRKSLSTAASRTLHLVAVWTLMLQGFNCSNQCGVKAFSSKISSLSSCCILFYQRQAKAFDWCRFFYQLRKPLLSIGNTKNLHSRIWCMVGWSHGGLKQANISGAW